MRFFDKLMSLSENQKKIILWILVIIFALVISILWTKKKVEDIKNFNIKKTINKLNFSDMSDLKIPTIDFFQSSDLKEKMDLLEEELKKEGLEEELNEEGLNEEVNKEKVNKEFDNNNVRQK